MMRQSVASYAMALLGVAAMAWLSLAFLGVLGLTSAALLFLLPVLYTATRSGVGPGLVAAVVGASAYNFFLLPPRYTFRVHGFDNLVSVFVLVAVALVTSRLATRLRRRESEALERARMSEELSDFSATLARHPAEAALDRGIALATSRYGELRLLGDAPLPEADAAFSSLDLAAAAWAIHNGDITGHGTEVMPAADWTFIPLAPKNRHDGAVAGLARPFDGGTRPPMELDHLRQVCLLLGQSRDRDALEAERREREILAESDRLRRALLAALAHDFRTPLTVVSGRLALLAKDNADVAEALAATRRLDRMMNDLLGAARMEEGALSPKLESLDLIDGIEAAITGLAIPSSISIGRAIPTDLPFVMADPVLLHHILTNLVDNAVRHANAHVVLAASGEGDSVLLTIEDDGPGIPETERVRIFDRFARIEGGDRTSGSGLGLAIVKGFADAMKMTVTVNASPTGSAQFVLAMPMANGHRV